MGRPQITKTEKRSATLSTAVSAKIRYLVELAARDEGRSVSRFVERAIIQALLSDRIPENLLESPSDATVPEGTLWGEGLWHEDEAERFYALATSQPLLLETAEKDLWISFCGAMSKHNEKITKARAIEYYNDSQISKSHLSGLHDEDGAK